MASKSAGTASVLDERSIEICTACRKVGRQPCNCAGDRTRKANAARNALPILFLRSSWIAESAMKVSPCENLAHHAPASVAWPRFYRSSFANTFSQWLRAKSQRSPLCRALAALTLSRGILVLAKSASLARRCPGLLWDPLSLTGLSNPGMNCYQIQLEYKCPQLELYKAS